MTAAARSCRPPLARRHLLQGTAATLAAAAIGPVAAAPKTPPAASPITAADAEAQRRLEALLEAVGGRTRWAALTHTRNDSQQNRLDEPTVVRAVITMDFTRPRWRIDTTAPGLRIARAVDGERHWRLSRAGVVEPMPAATLAEDRRWYAAHVYRTLHRLAMADPALAPRAVGARRLEVHEAGAGGARLAWFELDARGVPVLFGAHDDDEGTLSGPWDMVADGVRHPVWTARRDGSWRAWLRELVPNPPLPSDLFDAPARTG